MDGFRGGGAMQTSMVRYHKSRGTIKMVLRNMMQVLRLKRLLQSMLRNWNSLKYRKIKSCKCTVP